MAPAFHGHRETSVSIMLRAVLGRRSKRLPLDGSATSHHVLRACQARAAAVPPINAMAAWRPLTPR
jgi:hypothetical protein